MMGMSSCRVPAVKESMAHLRKTCSAAAAFSMLLRLKVYLKSAYGLTAARCQAYKPNDATKVTKGRGEGDIVLCCAVLCCAFFVSFCERWSLVVSFKCSKGINECLLARGDAQFTISTHTHTPASGPRRLLLSSETVSPAKQRMGALLAGRSRARFYGRRSTS